MTRQPGGRSRSDDWLVRLEDSPVSVGVGTWLLDGSQLLDWLGSVGKLLTCGWFQVDVATLIVLLSF